MSKQEFLDRLKNGLKGLPESDIEERLAFYSELIDDRLEEGMPEEEIVASLGDPQTVADEIIAETPFGKLVKERVKPRRTPGAGVIVLLVLGAPLWLPLLIALLAVFLSVFAVLWVLVLALWAVFLAFAVSSVGCLVTGIVFLFRGIRLTGLALLGGSLVCAGLSILMFFACLGCTKGCGILTKKIAVGIKRMLIKKEDA